MRQVTFVDAESNRICSGPVNAVGNYYLLFKALHIAFMVTWFAGLFYLPRLFIYHAQASSVPDRERFELMERRLFVIMTIGAALTTAFGANAARVQGTVGGSRVAQSVKSVPGGER